MRNTTIVLFLIIPFFLCILFLQFFLSKKNKYWGLILPSVTFLYSLAMSLSVPSTNELPFIPIFVTFLLSNIPTIILLGIYAGGRQKKNAQAQLDKMKIQDLD